MTVIEISEIIIRTVTKYEGHVNWSNRCSPLDLALAIHSAIKLKKIKWPIIEHKRNCVYKDKWVGEKCVCVNAKEAIDACKKALENN